MFISCPTEDNSGRPTYVGTIERWSNQALSLPNFRCGSNISLFVLVTGCRCLSLNRLLFFFFLLFFKTFQLIYFLSQVENMGRVNYGPYMFDEKVCLHVK